MRGLTYLEILVLGELVGQVHCLVGAPLGRHHNAPDLLHLGVVWGTHPVQVARDLQVEETRMTHNRLLTI